MVVLLLLLVVQSLATADLCQSGSMEHSETAMESAMALLYLQRLWQQRQLLDHIMGNLLARLGLLLMLLSKIFFIDIMSLLFFNQEVAQLQFKITDVTYLGTQSQTTTFYIFDFLLGIAVVFEVVMHSLRETLYD